MSALLGTDVASWVLPQVEGNCPARKSATMNLVDTNEIIVFGGRLAKGGVTNEMFTLKTGEKWSWEPRECHGTVPSPRECHSATLISGDRVLVFGGQRYDDTLNVFNDLYIFDPATNTWEVPEVDGKPPPARARHSATYFPENDCLYVFGGYRKTTRRLNDVYELNLDTMTWSQPEFEGDPPPPRYGHSACLVGNRVMIIGGIDSSNQTLQDVAFLDLAEKTWVDVEKETQFSRHVGMLSSCCMDSAGSKKIFAFGGQTNSIMEYTNKVCYLDTSTMQWKDAQLLSGNEPPPCADTAMIYDPSSVQLLVFGGAGNEYIEELYALDVRAIVGPPYAMFSLTPPMGPLHGGMQCIIEGEDFYADAPNIQVLFTDGKREVTARGTFKSENEVSFITPDLSAFGDRVQELTVRLSMENDEFTVNTVSMSIFLDTLASDTIAYGPGLLPLQATTFPTSFVIWAKNLAGQARTHGGDEFQIVITRIEEEEEGEGAEQADDEGKDDPAKAGAPGTPVPGRAGRPETPLTGRKQTLNKSQGASTPNMGASSRASTPAPGEDSEAEEGSNPDQEPVDQSIPFEVNDRDDGSYEVTYTIEEEGKYEVSVMFQGAHIRGSPFQDIVFSDKKQKTQVATPAKGSNFLPVMKVHVPERLSALEAETSLDQSTLAMKVGDGKVHTLLKVMGCLEDINTKRDKIDLELASLNETVRYLKSRGDMSAESHKKRLKALKEVWTAVKETAPQVDKDLVAHKNKAKVDIKRKIEAFNRKIEQFEIYITKRPFWNYSITIDEVFAEFDHVWGEHAKNLEYSEELQHLAVLFNYTALLNPSIVKLKSFRETLKAIKTLWDMIELVEAQFADWKLVKWADLQPESMEVRTREILKELRLVDKRCRDHGDAYQSLVDIAKNFQQSCPLVVNLRHESMRDRHWQQLMDTTGVHFTIDSTFCLADLLNLQLPRYENEVDAIVDRALKEERMEKALAKLKEVWAQVSFTYTQFQETDLKLIKITDEDFEQLENDQLVVQSMMGSKYLSTFETEVLRWRKGLQLVEKVMNLWGEIQRTWAYLVTLFIGSEEVKRDLPEDAARFVGVDKNVKEFLRSVEKQKNVYNVTSREGLLENLTAYKEDLEKCEKSLMDYLDSKRIAFPRFYFVSTTDLLDILCNGNNPTKIMVHMQKVILGIKSMELDEARFPPSAKDMTASNGIETVPFYQPLQLNGKVEQYLLDVIATMRKSLKLQLQKSMQLYPQKKREDWLLEVPAQIMTTTSQTIWSQEVNTALDAFARGDRQAVVKYAEKQKQQLDSLIEMVCGELPKPIRQKVMVLITLDTHQLDIVNRLIKDSVNSNDAFQWTSQLRYSWDDDEKEARINICDASFSYSYEYLGNGPRLVITPLTDRIYITATQSLHLQMGCAPAGPAGTGKTETTKDLAAAMGKPCYVFNCSDQMDYKGMGNIFKGLAAAGAWGCFDEFNRLVPAVLSVCSVQFKAVLDAVRVKSDTFTVEGATLKLDPSVGVFITMNPGYLGRTELPETLKTLFRPITVVVPDLELICENMLMAEGFKTAKILARKFTHLYKLLNDLLSKQTHYDWGLRAIKSVLVVAGGFKRAEPEVPELNLLMRALRDSNLAKIPTDDVPVFMGLIGDLFPGISIPRARDEKLESAVVDVCKDSKAWPELDGRALTPEPTFVLKVIQLEELLAIRHCVFAIGAAGCGKSSIWKTLAKARSSIGPHVTIRDINPKAITSNELYGYVELSTREWRDGLLSNIMRDLSTIPDTDPKWIILDGDLDANWIESMNSVMDDNRILTLASNERIPLLPHMRMIFEIRDLRFATPATVSRAGILYVSEGEQWKSFSTSWVEARSESSKTKELLLELFEKYVPTTIDVLAKQFKHLVTMVNFNMVQTLCFLLEGFLDPANAGEDELSPLAIETYFVFAAVWGFGSCLSKKDNVDYRSQFSEWWKEQFKQVKFPPRASVFDVFVDPVSKKFLQWRSVVEETPFDSMETPMNSVTVQIAETTSVMYFTKHLMSAGRPILLVGGAGVGKTALVRGILKSVQDELQSMTISLNHYSDSLGLQRNLEQALEKKAGRNFGPPGVKKLVYFVDDLNMPALDPYDTQGPIALMRQHFDYGHWYDRDKLSFKDIKNVNGCQYICAMNPFTGSFSTNPRLQRHFATFALDLPAPGSLMDIYRTFLAGHLQHFENPAVLELQTKLVHAALLLHSKISETFRKTALNFHYEFNMRHLANVFQGLLMAGPEQFKEDNSAGKFVQLWLHESERVYCDRLVSPQDISTYKKLAREVNGKFFSGFNLAHLFEDRNPSPNIFAHFAQGIGDKTYDLVKSMKSLKELLQESLNEYNEENAQMNLLLFDDALRHVCRISRILESPGGHALLVGVGGSGKQSLSRLAAYTCSFAVYTITISSSYGVNDLKEDLKTMFTRAGARDESIMFLLTEAQITNERFLIYINDLLASGNVAGLFNMEDMDNIINSIRVQVKQSGLDDTRDNCVEFFLKRVRENLHVVLCFSPVGESFRVRMRRFPALVSCTIIDWFQPWPEAALLGVAKKFLAEVDLGTDEVRKAVEGFMPYAFKNVGDYSTKYRDVERRYVYLTPKSFLEMINLYKSMLAKKRKQLADAIDRLTTGLDKLQRTGKDVEVLQEQLKIKGVEVEEKKLAADVFAEQVGKEKEIVEAESTKASEEAEVCARIQTEVSERQAKCEKELAAAEPAVQRAMEALDTLNKKDLGEMKALKTPPKGLDDVLIAVMVLLLPPNKIPKPDKRTWQQAVTTVGKVDQFINTLKTFKTEIDEQRVSSKNFDAVRYYLGLGHFNREAISVKSKAGGGLVEWVINIVEYYDIICTVEPMRQALALAESELDTANTRLKDINEKVAELEEQLNKVLAEFKEAEDAKMAMIAEVEKSQAKLDLAQRLMTALESENVRWQANVEGFNKDLEFIVGDALLASAFVSYIGGFNKKFRDDLLNLCFVPYLKENAVPLSPALDPLKILTTESEIAHWQNQGLPADRVSIENGTIVCSAERWPLIIDPQLQGISWLKEKASANNLTVVRLGQKNLLHTMQLAIENGHTILIENLAESIDAVLMSVVSRQVIKKLGVEYFQLGDKEVELNRDFQLYLHTKLSSPHYPPEIQAETTLINFAVTEDGLEDQLLATVVGKERPDLESQKLELIKQQNEFKIKLKELEDDLLQRLATAEGDLTEDVPLIENLEESKRVATEIGEKVQIAQETEKRINMARELYRPAATRGSLLFFLLDELNKINSFYQFSLQAFTTVFIRGIILCTVGKKAPKEKKQTEGSDDEQGSDNEGGDLSESEDLTEDELREKVQVRLDGLIDSVSAAVFSYTRRGLFDKHKLIFATQVALATLSKKGALDGDELEYLMKGDQVFGTKPDRERLSRFLNETVWANIQGLIKLPNFAKLSDEISKAADQWEKWCNEEAPELVDLPRMPGDKSPPRSQFQKLLIIRAIRPDRLSNALTQFIRENLGANYVEQEPFNMKEIYDESSKASPIFFILFPGAQPMKDIEMLAEGEGCRDKLVHLSMGQGQEPIAEKYLEDFGENGGWLFLDNVHLMQAWLPRLERKLELIAESGHDDFRCFYSAEPNPDPHVKNVPEAILKNSIKIVNEPPQDLKSNLRRAFANFTTEKFERSSKPEKYKPTLFALCFFHSLVLGRRKFGSQGWSRSYSFNLGDLNICADVLHNYIELNASVPWDDIRYMFGEIMYGGHITDNWDRLTCSTYLEELLRETLFNQQELAPRFPCPAPGDYEMYKDYIENKLPVENPGMFGLHSNAEIGFLSNEGQTIFKTIVDLTGGTAAASGGKKREDVVLKIVDSLLNQLPKEWEMLELNQRIPEKTPFIVVLLQECTRMNRLLSTIGRSLQEVKLGLTGALNITDAMETLTHELFTNKVPATWASVAYPSLKSLTPWFENLLARCSHLREWSDSLEPPMTVWLSALFNPMAFLTAIMQDTARSKNLPLDSMAVFTTVTKYYPEEVLKRPDDGKYIHGLFLEGCRWDTEENQLADSHLKDLHPVFPVVHITAGLIEDLPDKGVYTCPVYITSMRGPTFVWPALLPTDQSPNKWVLAGVALLLSDD